MQRPQYWEDRFATFREWLLDADTGGLRPRLSAVLLSYSYG